LGEFFMADDDSQYEFKSVRAVRGMEARTTAKLKEDGWEFVSESQGPLLQTKMTFRRPKPKQPWYVWAAMAGGLALMGIIVAVNAILGGGDEPTAPPADAATPQSEQPSAVPSEEPEEPEPTESAEAVPAESASEQTLTVENNEDLAALLAVPATSGAAVEEFAAKYSGRLIEFDGNISYMNNHGKYKTRYDMLIGAGDYSETTTTGPNFQFKDVNTFDLHLTGSNIPDYVGAGDNLHIIARVGEFNTVQELFFLEPISTELR
jgi:hypothetical protein